jgi:hypothetical protein
LQREADQWRP